MEIKKLIEAITVQTELLNELLQVLERETSEMANIDINAMNLSNQAKNELIARVAEHSQNLQRTTSALAVHEGLQATASLGAIAEHVAKKGNRQLLTALQQLGRIAEQLQEVTVLNSGIAERFVSNVTTALRLIASLINQSNVYGASGGYQQRPTGAVIINREA